MINRNNYEEYFLLLADNELSAEEATAVKQFAAQHPDLAEELNLLMSCRLEEVSMPVFPKEKLLRTTQWDSNNMEPVHTQMLLLLDGELLPAEKQQLEKQITSSISLQTEWNTLQQAKLAAEAITHPNKESLRRSNHKVRPLLWMRWTAAAAVVAGLGWLFWLQQPQQSAVPSNTLASNPLPVQKPKTAIPVPANDQQPLNTADVQPMQASQVVTNSTTPATNHTHQQANTRPEEAALRLAANDNSRTISVPGTTNSPTEAEPVTNRLSSVDVSLSTGDPDPAIQVAHLSTKTVALPILTASQKAEPFTGSKGDLAAEDDYVTVGGAHINKQKIRGLFRNVTRTVSRSFTKSKIEPDVYATR